MARDKTNFLQKVTNITFRKYTVTVWDPKINEFIKTIDVQRYVQRYTDSIEKVFHY